MKSHIMSIAAFTPFLDPSNANERSSIGRDPGTRLPLESASPEVRPGTEARTLNPPTGLYLVVSAYTFNNFHI